MNIRDYPTLHFNMNTEEDFIRSTTLNFELITGSSLYNKNEGIAIDDRHDNECLLFDITPKDVHDFITSGSFLGTVFDRLNIKLPPWLQFSKSGYNLEICQYVFQKLNQF
jgi:hypothetical protein